jgi:hypothetical protein
VPVGVDVGVGDWVVPVGVGLAVGLDGVVPPVPVSVSVGVGEPVSVGVPPCTVTTIPPGLKTICAVQSPLGAAAVAVAVTCRLCPTARVPELWLRVSQDTEGAADQCSGAWLALRSRICTLSGSAARWLTLT